LNWVVSHPFARKKAKGWGTEIVQILVVRDLENGPCDFVPLGLVLSHPFARKKAKGWGTEIVQILVVRGLAIERKVRQAMPGLSVCASLAGNKGLSVDVRLRPQPG
jgi:hypothetical protein